MPFHLSYSPFTVIINLPFVVALVVLEARSFMDFSIDSKRTPTVTNLVADINIVGSD